MLFETPKAFANFSLGLLQPQEIVVDWFATLKALVKGRNVRERVQRSEIVTARFPGVAATPGSNSTTPSA